MKLKKYLPMEGGLGAQILTTILGNFLKSEGIDVSYDMSYFSLKQTEKTPEVGVSIWPYHLDYYSLAIDTFKSTESSTQIIHFVKWLTRRKIYSPYLYDGSNAREDLLNQALLKLSYVNLFPIALLHIQRVKELTQGFSSYAVVHLRRGDFLNVANFFIIEEQRAINALKSCTYLPEKLLITSDGACDIGLWKREFPSIIIELFESNDLLLTHALMRHADVLITSNSQYSYTAAVLGMKEDQMVWIPAKWRMVEQSFLKFLPKRWRLIRISYPTMPLLKPRWRYY